MSHGTGHISSDKTVDRTPVLRLLADDLTGALDTAAHFASIARPIAIGWHDSVCSVPTPLTVIDTTCREATTVDAAHRFAQYLHILEPTANAATMLKLDSLLRGHPAAEIAACARRWPNRSIIVAPALPEQHRVTRAGRQYWILDGSTEPVGEDLPAVLAQHGIPVTVCSRNGAPAAGVCIFDAETDADLDRVARLQTAVPPVWCGSSGLAKAIARRQRDGSTPVQPRLPLPILGLFGSNHPVLARQLAAVSRYVLPIGDDAVTRRQTIEERLHRDRIALANFPIAGASREDARTIVERRCVALLAGLDPPATLLVSGGETLRAVCMILGATSLEVDGQAAPGLPNSLIRGGAWAGVRVASKSGAFGTPDVFIQLFASALASADRSLQ